MNSNPVNHIKPYINKEISIKKQVKDVIEHDNFIRNKALSMSSGNNTPALKSPKVKPVLSD